MAVTVSLKLTAAEIETLEWLIDQGRCKSRSDFLVTAMHHEMMRLLIPLDLSAEMRIQRLQVQRRRKKGTTPYKR